MIYGRQGTLLGVRGVVQEGKTTGDVLQEQSAVSQIEFSELSMVGRPLVVVNITNSAIPVHILISSTPFVD